jgi:serine protease Do
VLVADVTKGAPGAKAGLKEGDIILSVDGKPVNDRAQLRNRISLAGVGETVRLALWREGREMPLNVKLEALPADAQVASRSAGGEGEDAEGGTGGIDGVTVRELTAQQRRVMNVPDDLEGVVVTGVDQTSNAWQEGLREGDVITEVSRQPVTGAAEFRKLLGRDKGKPVLLRVWKRGPQGGNGGRIFMAIPR